MRHRASPRFWAAYKALPQAIRGLADKNFRLLKADLNHPSLQFKKIGPLRSVRIGLRYRALAVETDEGLVRFWIGSHADYNAPLKNSD